MSIEKSATDPENEKTVFLEKEDLHKVEETPVFPEKIVPLGGVGERQTVPPADTV